MIVFTNLTYRYNIIQYIYGEVIPPRPLQVTLIMLNRVDKKVYGICSILTLVMT